MKSPRSLPLPVIHFLSLLGCQSISPKNERGRAVRKPSSRTFVVDSDGIGDRGVDLSIERGINN